MKNDHRQIILRRRAALLSVTLAAAGCEREPPVVPPSADAAPTISKRAPSAATASSEVDSSSSPPDATALPIPSASAALPLPPRPLAMVCLSIVIIEQVLFDAGALTPTASSIAVIDAAADILHDRPPVRIAVEGHADSQETAQGRDPSQARAQTVLQMLIDRGVDPSRLCLESYGATRPLAAPDTPANRARNRRVTFRLLHEDEACAGNP